ncbi:hypothetical protein EVAR_32655_1 [Eumeta japonica]|uniref:Uncharacterized protein n=1 Tax=Eumeta variegata TaxID=151549 RepID=A0A4C1WSE4_EUMVA|nr:hypothetical protein EVAR_32655_1 [Eumeta japonica]
MSREAVRLPDLDHFANGFRVDVPRQTRFSTARGHSEESGAGDNRPDGRVKVASNDLAYQLTTSAQRTKPMKLSFTLYFGRSLPARPSAGRGVLRPAELDATGDAARASAASEAVSY